jgi:uncharacterized membrane protein (DUF2068 family)
MINSQDTDAPHKRSVKFTILVLLVVLQAFGIAAAFFSNLSTGNVLGLVFIGVLAVVTILLVWGLWRLRPWSFWVAIVVEVIYLALGLLNWWHIDISQLSQNDKTNAMWPIVISLVVLVSVIELASRARLRQHGDRAR